MEPVAQALDQAIFWFNDLFPGQSYFAQFYIVRGLLAVILISLICGSVGSLVAGNRMAFFSDALAHCAFAGVALGFLIALSRGVTSQTEFYQWVTPVMVGFGICIGLGIAFVREKTTLASDTVIGVFFAGALGFGAILLNIVSRRKYFSPENFLFGDLMNVQPIDIVYLAILAVVTLLVLGWMYNDLVFASFNPSLARSRQVRVRLCNYVFIVLLAVVINMCLQAVGVLLINALLIVPAATAGNVCRNMRQLFWTTVGLCLMVGIVGQWLSWEISVSIFPDESSGSFGVGGVMVVLSVVLFFLSLLWSLYRKSVFDLFRSGAQRLGLVRVAGLSDNGKGTPSSPSP